MYLVHTSDRIHFKTCRRSWFWASPLHEGLRPVSTSEALWFGTAVHRGLEAYAKGEDYRDVFTLHVVEHKQELIGAEPSLEDDERFVGLVTLGLGMLDGYKSWIEHEQLNKTLQVLGTEVRFKIPLLGRTNAYYAGKCDVLYLDTRTNLLWVGEFKTTAQFGTVDFLSWDEQCGSYVWAFEQWRDGNGVIDESTLLHGIDPLMNATRVEGIIYDDLRKKLPAIPRVLQSGFVSEAKNQDTTYEVYRAFLEDHGFDPEAYKDMLDFLKSKPNNFFRRNKVRRNTSELSEMQNNILAEAHDMLDPHLSLYPNPGYRSSNCQRCAFTSPCLAMNDGLDPQEMLLASGNYKKKEWEDGDEFFRDPTS